MAGQGSTGNIIAAVCSFFLPGLGQLVQGRIVAAAVFALMGIILWVIGVVTFGLLSFLIVIPHLWATIDAALYKPRFVGTRGYEVA